MNATAKPAPSSTPARSELTTALTSCRTAFLGVGLFSGVSNVLMLTGAFFMLQIYDRVLTSGSVPTLVAVVLLAAGLFIALAIIDLIRGRILVRIGASLDEDLSARVYDTIVRLPLKAKSQGDGLQPLRDLDAIRAFLSGMGPTALFDLPWMPVYLAIIFAFHPMLGLTALVGAIILIVLTILTEVLTRAPTAAATGFTMTGLSSLWDGSVLKRVRAGDGVKRSWSRNREASSTSNLALAIEAVWYRSNSSHEKIVLAFLSPSIRSLDLSQFSLCG